MQTPTGITEIYPLTLAKPQARHIKITGRVQGVGFRPFVSRLAHQLNLSGWVRNHAGQVEIWVQGSLEKLNLFEQQLITNAPPLAKPDQPDSQPVTAVDITTFSILASVSGDVSQAHIPPDYFICDDCLAEMHDKTQRRYRYPFINCTQCGPRYTLIKQLPYDRPNTSMAFFPLCSECRKDYENPVDRRFHAQPLACPDCGPSLSFCRPGNADINDNAAAINATIAALKAGLIVAVKGVGGYHLLCSATSEAVVLKLRQRKQRRFKPLAVMLPWSGDDGLDYVRHYTDATATEIAQLTDPSRPIVLIKKCLNTGLAESVAPGMHELGIMLPYSPLHHLLLEDYAAPLIATSANISGEPVFTESEQVENRLGHIADAFLHHNRPILKPADDSVYRVIAGSAQPIRLGRGCAPLEFTLPFTLSSPLLAVGGQMKNTIALAWNNRVVISPHIGNLGSPRSQQVFEQTIADLTRLYGVTVNIVFVMRTLITAPADGLHVQALPYTKYFIIIPMPPLWRLSIRFVNPCWYLPGMVRVTAKMAISGEAKAYSVRRDAGNGSVHSGLFGYRVEKKPDGNPGVALWHYAGSKVRSGPNALPKPV